MKKRESIFFEDWRTCLREHYLHVIRTGDTVTEPTLRMVLQQVGFGEAEIDALYEEALRQDKPSKAKKAKAQRSLL